VKLAAIRAPDFKEKRSTFGSENDGGGTWGTNWQSENRQLKLLKKNMRQFGIGEKREKGEKRGDKGLVDGACGGSVC